MSFISSSKNRLVLNLSLVLLLAFNNAGASDSSTDQNELTCVIWSDFSYYDLSNLKLSDSNYETTDDDSNTYYFNLCSYVVATDSVDSSCDGTSNVYAYFTDSSSNCYDLTDNEISSLTSGVSKTNESIIV